ncbi:flagellar basal body P-ring formation chaperone FlgA [uncultured Sulfitobacter sp.]|uniref:flagellar basal body P-ring formation chaperone FlgA n=1 Tax=uncultured Sulfitobacter sp. TaxID=191468 RepID=UPI0026343D1E|nr:flagellar basal body P-ring formation chaperone FlgA [uncultured Sulfitobacter sp.]
MIRLMTRRIVEWIAVILVLLLGLTFWSDFAQASQDSVAMMIEERAAVELGPTLPNNSRIEIRLAAGSIQNGDFIQEFWMDPKTGQFIANVMTEYGVPQRVWGVAVVTIEVPVPTRQILPDEIIQVSDITTVEMPLQRLGTFAVRAKDDVIGKQVRRMLSVGRPVPRQSVIPPKLVTRGEKVKIVLNQGGLRLTAKGRALADAHLDQEIRVVNLSSNKTISAIARSHGVVEVDQ